MSTITNVLPYGFFSARFDGKISVKRRICIKYFRYFMLFYNVATYSISTLYRANYLF